MKLPERENLLNPWLPKSGICMIHAIRGVGKTYCALEIAMAVANGSNFLSFSAPKKSKVLYIDGEMPAKTMQDRLIEIKNRIKMPEEMSEPSFITPDLQHGIMPDLSTPEGRIAVDPHVKKSDLIIVDNISTLCGPGKENESDSWAPIQQWALSVRRERKSILFVHHSGKNGTQRGTSKREDIMDTVIMLKHPSDYTPSMGACFELHFEKSRGIYDKQVDPILCRLTNGNWTHEPLSNSKYHEVIELFKTGLKQVEIANKLSLSPGQVSKILSKARKNGELSE